VEETMIKVLLIDDDERLGELLQSYFKKFEIDLTHCTHPDEGISRLRQEDFDFVLLDVMLPDRDGFEVCRSIRSTSQIPIMMLTARGELADRVVGLEIGADDYVSKPFEPRELVARIERFLKRMKNLKSADPKRLVFDNLQFDISKRKIFVGETELELTTTEYQLLELFAKNVGKNFTRDEIQNALRGSEADVFSRSIDIMVSRLRQKLKAAGCDREVIKTVWGTGYSFIP
jgi:OmpR family response regulator RpaB